MRTKICNPKVIRQSRPPSNYTCRKASSKTSSKLPTRWDARPTLERALHTLSMVVLEASVASNATTFTPVCPVKLDNDLQEKLEKWYEISPKVPGKSADPKYNLIFNPRGRFPSRTSRGAGALLCLRQIFIKFGIISVNTNGFMSVLYMRHSLLRYAQWSHKIASQSSTHPSLKIDLPKSRSPLKVDRGHFFEFW